MDQSAGASRGEKRKRDGKDQAEEELSWVRSKFSDVDLQADLDFHYTLTPLRPIWTCHLDGGLDLTSRR